MDMWVLTRVMMIAAQPQSHTHAGLVTYTHMEIRYERTRVHIPHTDTPKYTNMQSYQTDLKRQLGSRDGFKLNEGTLSVLVCFSLCEEVCICCACTSTVCVLICVCVCVCHNK